MDAVQPQENSGCLKRWVNHQPIAAKCVQYTAVALTALAAGAIAFALLANPFTAPLTLGVVISSSCLGVSSAAMAVVLHKLRREPLRSVEEMRALLVAAADEPAAPVSGSSGAGSASAAAAGSWSSVRARLAFPAGAASGASSSAAPGVPSFRDLTNAVFGPPPASHAGASDPALAPPVFASSSSARPVDGPVPGCVPQGARLAAVVRAADAGALEDAAQLEVEEDEHDEKELPRVQQWSLDQLPPLPAEIQEAVGQDTLKTMVWRIETSQLETAGEVVKCEVDGQVVNKTHPDWEWFWKLPSCVPPKSGVPPRYDDPVIQALMDDKEENQLWRFVDIPPGPETICSVVSQQEPLRFHANRVGPNLPLTLQFIAAQAPIVGKASNELFWLYAFQSKAQTIIDLTKDAVVGADNVVRPEIDRYAPLVEAPLIVQHSDIPPLTIALTSSKEIAGGYGFIESYQMTQGDISKSINRFHFTKWIDMGGTSTDNLRFILTGLRGQNVIHCKAGVGRTGTVILTAVIEELIKGKHLNLDTLTLGDVVRILCYLRQDRPWLVQQPVQFALVLDYLRKRSLGLLQAPDAES